MPDPIGATGRQSLRQDTWTSIIACTGKSEPSARPHRAIRSMNLSNRAPAGERLKARGTRLPAERHPQIDPTGALNLSGNWAPAQNASSRVAVTLPASRATIEIRSGSAIPPLERGPEG